MRDALEETIAEFSRDTPNFRELALAALRRRELARKLAAKRKRAGLTQGQVAKQMQTSVPVVSRIEAGADVRFTTMERYLAALGLQATWSVKAIGHNVKHG